MRTYARIHENINRNKLIQADLLCTWKRTCSNNPSEPSLHVGKELWIFWYGDEPSTLSKLISSDLRGMCFNKDVYEYILYIGDILL